MINCYEQGVISMVVSEWVRSEEYGCTFIVMIVWEEKNIDFGSPLKEK